MLKLKVSFFLQLKMLVHLHHQVIKVDKNIVELVMTNKVKLVPEHLDQNS